LNISTYPRSVLSTADGVDDILELLLYTR